MAIDTETGKNNKFIMTLYLYELIKSMYKLIVSAALCIQWFGNSTELTSLVNPIHFVKR